MKHGLARRNVKRPYLYHRWQHMIQRCHNPNYPDYPRYGGRGIYVCDRWRFGEDGVSGFTLFMEDVGKYARRNLSMDRIDNSKGYEPGNVRWATTKQQANNRRSTKFLTIDGVTRPLSEWSEMYGIGSKAILYRLKQGWSHAEAVTTPKNFYHRGNPRKND